MQTLRDPSATALITDPDIRALVAFRFAQLCEDEPYDPEVSGFMIVVEAGDTVAALEEASGIPILGSFTNATRFGDLGYVPSSEFLDEHANCYEMVFIMGNGYGIDIFVPKTEGIDAELLAMCAQFATPAPQSQLVPQ